MPDRRLSRDEIGERGVAIYDAKLRSILEPQFRGQFVAIDVESGDYEVADDADAASDRLWARRPDAQVLVERIGYPAAFNARRTMQLSVMITGRIDENLEVRRAWRNPPPDCQNSRSVFLPRLRVIFGIQSGASATRYLIALLPTGALIAFLMSAISYSASLGRTIKCTCSGMNT